MINPYDQAALEACVRLKERLGKGSVTVITIGDPAAEETLKLCLAMGADAAVHLEHKAFSGLDPVATASALSKTISSMKYDLIVCGKKSIDGNNSQVGAFIADFLHLPLITDIAKIEEIDETTTSCKVQKYLGKGERERVECKLPAVLTVELMINKPRYPTVPMRLSAMQKEIRKIEPDSAGISQANAGVQGPTTRVINLHTPKPIAKLSFMPDDGLSAAERVQLIVSGGIAEKTGNMINKPPREAAHELISFLVEQKFLSPTRTNAKKDDH
jgi:electron transfer flavoprotein beta subunit